MSNDTSAVTSLSAGATTGGLALAAGELFLPETMEEAAARDGAADGRLGGQRGKDQKGRH